MRRGQAKLSTMQCKTRPKAHQFLHNLQDSSAFCLDGDSRHVITWLAVELVGRKRSHRADLYGRMGMASLIANGKGSSFLGGAWNMDMMGQAILVAAKRLSNNSLISFSANLPVPRK